MTKKRAKRTPRGFEIFGEYKDSRGNVVRLQQSSAAGVPFVWIFVHGPNGNDVYEHLGKFTAVSPHLTRAQARRIARALLRFAA
jgi:hypothetical protein